MQPTIPNRFRSDVVANYSGTEQLPDIDPADADRLIQASIAAEAEARAAVEALTFVGAGLSQHAFDRVHAANTHLNSCINTIRAGRTGASS